MEISVRVQNVGLAVLCAITVGTTGLAYWSVNRTSPPPDGGVVASPGTSGMTQPVTPDAASATTSAPTSGATSATAAPDGGPRSVADWRAAWSDEADVLVVGDGLSNMPTQWLQLWAGLIGQDRPVTIHHWGEAADVAFNDPIVLSDSGAGEPLTLWSGSRAGSTIAAAAEHYDRFVDASAQPDAVLVTLGLSSADEDIGAGLDDLVDEIPEDVPVLVAVGPRGLYEEGVGDALLSWSEEHFDRVGVVDLRGVAPATPTAEQWAQAFAQALRTS